MRKRTPRYTEDLAARLRDKRYAADYLTAALSDDEVVFLLALRDVVESHRVSHIAKQSALNRETLYRTLSEKGNPTLKTLSSVLDALGLKLVVAVKDTEHSEAVRKRSTRSACATAGALARINNKAISSGLRQDFGSPAES